MLQKYKIADYALEVTPGEYKSAHWNTVTQGRDGRGYSSCADLAHYCLERWYGESEVAVDRELLNRAPEWKVGLNIAKLLRGGKKHGCLGSIWNKTKPEPWEVGNIVIIADPSGLKPWTEHVMVVVAKQVDEASNTHYVATAEWGQTDSKGRQCGVIKNREVKGRKIVGSTREVMWYLDLDSYV